MPNFIFFILPSLTFDNIMCNKNYNSARIGAVFVSSKFSLQLFLFSALTLLVGRQEGHTACKNRVVGCWHGYLSGARCRLAYGPADATVSCFSKIQIGFSFLVPAHLGSPGKGPLNGCARVCVLVYTIQIHTTVAQKERAMCDVPTLHQRSVA